MRRSTFNDEHLGEVVSLSGYGNWANVDLYEIIQDLVGFLPPLQTQSLESSVAALSESAVRK